MKTPKNLHGVQVPVGRPKRQSFARGDKRDQYCILYHYTPRQWYNAAKITQASLKQN